MSEVPVETLRSIFGKEESAREKRLDQRKYEYQVWLVDGQILNTDHLMISAGGVAIGDGDPTAEEFEERGSHVFYPYTQVLRINARWWIPDEETAAIDEVRGRYL